MSLLDRLFRRDGDEKAPETPRPEPTNRTGPFRPSTAPPSVSSPPPASARAPSGTHDPDATPPPAPPLWQGVGIRSSSPTGVAAVRPTTTPRPHAPLDHLPTRATLASRTTPPDPAPAAPIVLARPWNERKRQQREEAGAHAIASLIEKAVDELGDPLIDKALDDLFDPSGGTARSGREGVSTAVDLAAVQSTYQDLAVEYCAPVRNVMIEVGRGEPPVSALDFVRPALKWLQSTAETMDLTDLAAALDNFGRAMTAAGQPGQATIRGETKQGLQRAYAQLVLQLPQAFDIEGERERREGIILRSLLLLVPGVDAMMVDRVLAAGLHTLQALTRARPDDLVAVAGLEPMLAARIVETLRAEQGTVGFSLASADVAEEKKRLKTLVTQLAEEHDAYERACAGWTEAHREEKRRFRGDRELTFLRIKVSLARLGDVDRIVRLERLPFAGKIQELETQLRIASSLGGTSTRASGIVAPA